MDTFITRDSSEFSTARRLGMGIKNMATCSTESGTGRIKGFGCRLIFLDWAGIGRECKITEGIQPNFPNLASAVQCEVCY